mgnify:CR=1 FL=1
MLCSENKFDKAVELFDKDPDPFNACTLLLAMPKVPQNNQGSSPNPLSIYNTSKRVRPPDLRLISALISACRRTTHLRHALQVVLDDIDRLSIPLLTNDELSMHTLVAASGDAPSARRVLAVVRATAALI